MPAAAREFDHAPDVATQIAGVIKAATGASVRVTVRSALYFDISFAGTAADVDTVATWIRGITRRPVDVTHHADGRSTGDVVR